MGVSGVMMSENILRKKSPAFGLSILARNPILIAFRVEILCGFWCVFFGSIFVGACMVLNPIHMRYPAAAILSRYAIRIDCMMRKPIPARQ